MRVSTPVASDTTVLTTASVAQSHPLNNHNAAIGGVAPQFAGKNGMQQAPRTITSTVQQQSSTWSNSSDNYTAHQGLTSNATPGTTLVAYSKPSVTTTMANVSIAKQLTTLTTVNKVPQVGVQSSTGIKQTVQITSSQPVRLAAPNAMQTSGLTIPQGMVLARNQNGQLFFVSGNTLASSATTNTSTVLVTQSSTSGAITTLKNSTTFAVTQPIVQNSSTTTPGQVVARTVVPVTNSVTVKPVPSKQTIVSNKVPSTSQATPTPQPTQPSLPLSQEDIVNVTKCRNFLTTLIQLASNGGQSAETVSNVKKLVQNLIDNKIDPDSFTQQLQIELHSAPQPYLGPFLKKSLPLLRLTMIQQSRTPGSVPPTVAAVRTSTSSSLTPLPMNVPSTKTVPVLSVPKRPQPKMKNSVPDIRLPRVSPSPSPVQYQTTIGGQVAICRASASMPPPTVVLTNPRMGVQKWSSPGGNVGGGGTFKDDDDINDVTSMAGVNLSEESDRILATNSDLVGSQVRSCQDSCIVNTAALIQKMKEIVSKHPHVKQIHPDAIRFAAHAVEARVKDVIEKVSLVACHRIANYKDDEHYEASQYVKSQLKFLTELDVLEKKRHQQSEREVLMKAMKSRSKNEDPEQQRLKQKAKEMQQLELEQIQIRNADETARAAIGPRKKKPKLDQSIIGGETRDFSSPLRSTPSRPRIKRVNLKDLVFVLEQEKDTNKSRLLYKSYLK